MLLLEVSDMERTALVIGATGGVGGETAIALVAAGWKVRALARRPEEAARTSPDPRIEWVKGDAMDAASVLAAARGVSVIVHGANPPGYRNWKGLALPMLESTIAAAKAVGARIVFPGTVYNFGPEVMPRVRETAEQRPRTRKGAIRVEMEQRLRASGVPVLIVRAGDFFGARAKNSWFSQGIVQPGAPLRRLFYPAKANLGHQWAYLPDLARTIVRLLDRSADLEPFAVFHFRGHWFARGVEIAEATRRAAGAPSARIWPFPWFFVYLLAPFVETFREMIEMRYLWKQELELVNDKLVAFLGDEPHTALDVALATTLRGLGCLPAEVAPVAAALETPRSATLRFG
jgi:nucleoside-diphosphate-sugar epimerase